MSIFNGKVAIITGAGSGIGKALAEEMARRGSHVVISDVNTERIESVGEGITKMGGKATTLTLDVRDYDGVKKMVDDTVAEHKQLDYIFNNAGIGIGGEVRDISIDDWREVIDINLYGVINGVAAAYPVMVKQGSGHIVNTSSIEGICPFPGTVSYVASKHAVLGLSSSLRVEGADLGVKVSAVCPGYILTRIFEDAKAVNMDRDKMFEKMLPPDWVGITPEECAKVILKGVARNKAIIPVTAGAKILWFLQRLSPNLVIWMMKAMIRKNRKDGVRLEDKT